MWDSKRDTDVKKRLLDFVGEGKGGMIWENGIENMYITVCEIDHQSKFDAWNRALTAGALEWPRGMGWGGKCEGFWDGGDTCTPLADLHQCMAPQHCKVISLQLK